MLTKSEINERFFQAISCGNKMLVSKYLDLGADLKAVDDKQKGPISLAYHLKFLDVVNLITEKGSDFAKSDLASGLLYAVYNKEYSLVSLLLQKGAEPTRIQSNSGNDCLHLAVINKDAKMLALLLHYHKDTKYLNKAKQTPNDINPVVYKLGWVIKEYHMIISTIIPLFVQGQRQNNCVFYGILDEILQLILNEVFDNVDLDKRLLLKNTKESYKKIGLQCLISEYSNCSIFKKSFQSLESQALVRNIEENLSSLQQIDSHIDKFLTDKYKYESKDKSDTRVIQLMKKYHLIDDNILKRKQDELHEKYIQQEVDRFIAI